jgi:uncharacterized protein YlbG (UPF0298 family)
MATLYEIIGALEKNGFEEYHLGFLLYQSTYIMSDKKDRFVSRLSENTPLEHVKRVQKEFMKYIKKRFEAALAKKSAPSISLDDISNLVLMEIGEGNLPSLEGMLFPELRQCCNKEEDIDSAKALFAAVGKKLKSAEAVYYNYTCREGENYPLEYKTLVNHLHPNPS